MPDSVNAPSFGLSAIIQQLRTQGTPATPFEGYTYDWSQVGASGTQVIPAETVWNYEGGLKLSSGPVSGSLGVYYQVYDNFQVSVAELDSNGNPTGSFVTESAGTASNLGAEAELVLRVRIEDDLCTFSVDTSGALLHKRGFKTGTGKAPMRETLAALFLRGAGFDGSAPVVDPMCGSGTFVIEAAEMAMGLAPGRGRSFAFERLASFDADAWAAMRSQIGANLTDTARARLAQAEASTGHFEAFFEEFARAQKVSA